MVKHSSRSINHKVLTNSMLDHVVKEIQLSNNFNQFSGQPGLSSKAIKPK
jgi:hypothetical protein